MIILTELAAEKIKEFAKEESIENLTLRTRIEGGGCVGLNYFLEFEEGGPKLNDKIFEQFEIKLIVDQMSHIYLDGTVIDFITTDMGSGFKFINENLAPSCGGCKQNFTCPSE